VILREIEAAGFRGQAGRGDGDLPAGGGGSMNRRPASAREISRAAFYLLIVG